jgi:hypothetical protein
VSRELLLAERAGEAAAIVAMRLELDHECA